MSRFRGEFNYSIDAKGRINIPAKFRKALSPEANETFVICGAPDKSLRAYPQDAWERYEDELALRPQTPETLRHIRLLRSTVKDSKLDSQGRIILSAKQIAFAKIKKNITLIGHYGFIEIWDTERYLENLGDGEDFDRFFYESVETGLRAR